MAVQFSIQSPLLQQVRPSISLISA